MDCDKKFRNPIRSMKIVRQISDYLCAERGLSIVENPKPSRGSYRDWQDKNEPQSNRDKLQNMIDNNISAGMVFEQFIAAMSAAGCEVKRGKYLSFKIPGAERFIRVKFIGDDYTEQALRERCVGKRPAPKRDNVEAQAEPKTAAYTASQYRPKLLIDIEAKLQKAHSPGFEHYARIYNLKEMARTLIFLKERGIGTYDELNKKIRTMDSEHDGKTMRIKEIETRQKEISELQQNIGTYNKTKDTYNEYRRLKKYQQTKWEKFRNVRHPADVYYDANDADIIHCQAAKKYFDEHGYGKDKKIPTIQSLKEEYAILEKEKRGLYNGYSKQRDDVNALKLARQNVDMFLDDSYEKKLLERSKSHGRDAR